MPKPFKTRAVFAQGRFRRFAGVVLAAGLAGLLPACAVTPNANPPQTELHSGKCAVLLQSLEQAVHASDMRDAQYAVIDGFPLYRVDRVLASLSAEADTVEKRSAWLRQASSNSLNSYAIEVANLSASAANQLPSEAELQAVLSDCVWQQNAMLLNDYHWQSFSQRIHVPSEYHAVRKVLGLYPLTNLGMKAGIASWQADTRTLFNAPIVSLSDYHQWLPSNTSSRPVGDIVYNALGLPELTAAQWQTLANNHAPTWMLEQGGDFDQPGKPLPGAAFEISPVVYWQSSIGSVHGKFLPQISYFIWFSERPKEKALDILGGKLDGLVWRLTLDQNERGDWQPLMYDSIHPCGCYHLFFPTSDLPQCAVDQDRENAFVPQAAPAGEFAIWVQSATHYVQQLKAVSTPVATSSYQLRPLDELRYANQNGQRLYGSDGIVTGTERLERFLLWTSGLVSPGAMRQWGSHATAFSGERYFDEPALFDKEFCLVEAVD